MKILFIMSIPVVFIKDNPIYIDKSDISCVLALSTKSHTYVYINVLVLVGNL